MIGNQIGVSTNIDKTKIEKIAQLIWDSKREVYAFLNRRHYDKPWTKLSSHEQNKYREEAERFLKFNAKYF